MNQKFILNIKFIARTPEMDDLWKEKIERKPPAAGHRTTTPDMEDLWDADPQSQFNI